MDNGRIYPKKGIIKRPLIKLYFKKETSEEDFKELYHIIKRNYFKYLSHISWTHQVISENRIEQEVENDYQFIPKLKYHAKKRNRFADIKGVSQILLKYFKFPKKDYCILQKTHLGESHHYFFFNKNFLQKKSLRNVKSTEYFYVPEPFFKYIMDVGIMGKTLDKGSDNEIYEFKEGYYNNIRQFFNFRYTELEKLQYLEQLRQEGLDYLVKKNFLK